MTQQTQKDSNFYDKCFNLEFYPEGTKPPDNRVFVFASNEHGRHGKKPNKNVDPSSYIAMHKFGAAYSNPHGINGCSYALCVLAGDGYSLPTSEIIDNIGNFKTYCNKNRDFGFFVVDIFREIENDDFEKIVRAFKGIVNCQFPESFAELLRRK